MQDSSNTAAYENAEYPFLPLLPGTLWPGVESPDRVLSVGQIELFDV